MSEISIWSFCSSLSLRSTSLMFARSIFQPVSFDARRTFCPSLPMASESWSSSTMARTSPSASLNLSAETFAGASALETNSFEVSLQLTISIFSP